VLAATLRAFHVDQRFGRVPGEGGQQADGPRMVQFVVGVGSRRGIDDLAGQNGYAAHETRGTGSSGA
jgi:hypothetical protein